jgi:uncharacterized protein YegP (UPF0339 family)
LSFRIQYWCWCLSNGSVIVSSKSYKEKEKKIPSSNTIQFQSHQKKKKEKKGVWRQLCEYLSEAEAHLPPTVSQLLLQALFIADLRNEFYTHLAPQALFI